MSAYDVVGVGNAILDVLSHADDDFLKLHGLNKGAMTLVSQFEAEKLYGFSGPGIECSGGSAANTIAGIASFGGRAAYIGKVANDQLGQVFAHDLKAIGVDYRTSLLENGASTARCLVMVTPDAQRTMLTYLGACVELGPEDIDPAIISAASVTYLEGYLWDPPLAKEAFIKAANIAHNAGRRVALSLSDAFCVSRHREDFLKLIEGHIDILFANESEIMSLYEVDNFDQALQAVKGHCEIAALTRGPKGSVAIAGDEVYIIDAEKISQVVDTTGAGDLYAAGFLYGLTQNRSLADCARIGGIAAAHIISHFGARPEIQLKTLL